MIHPPTAAEQFWRGIGYCFVAVIGVANVITPAPFTLERQLGLAVFFWSLFLASAIPAAFATWYGRYRIEYTLLPLFTTALIVAVISAWTQAAFDPFVVPRAATGSALVSLCIARFIALHRLIKVLQWTKTLPT